MTPRERWMAAIRMEAVDRLPFWPKLDGSYARHQAEPFRRMRLDDLHRYVGSDRHVWGPACVRTVRRRTRVETAAVDGLRRTVYHTPAGVLAAVERYDPLSDSYHPREFPVKAKGDIEAMRLVFEDATCEFDAGEYEKARALVGEVGEDGVVATTIGVSPLMDWLQHLAGIENGHLLLADWPGLVEGLFEAMHRWLCRRAEIIAARSPYEIIYSIENTSTTLISPALFRRYCLGHLRDYGGIVRAAGTYHVLHMCGRLKALLDGIGGLPAAGVEAFTSSPVGDTSLLDGRAACADKCLIGGTNAALWLGRAERIIEGIRRALDELPHRRGIVVTSAGVMPPACPPETIRTVAEWVKRYPAG